MHVFVCTWYECYVCMCVCGWVYIAYAPTFINERVASGKRRKEFVKERKRGSDVEKANK